MLAHSNVSVDLLAKCFPEQLGPLATNRHLAARLESEGTHLYMNYGEKEEISSALLQENTDPC